MLTESSWWGSPKDSVVLTRRIDNRLTEWEPPSPDFLKFNADGATVECPGMTGSGGVLRDDKGAMLAMFYGLLGYSLPFDGDRDWFSVFQNVIREKNGMTDSLAKVGIHGGSGFCERLEI
ncbi:hypothetical protein Golax_001542 [Gossypium laxum]|uniref:RNase H type-1 domain-containing protein n=1 Tax=Gossypium laxum TaxID=34288 RepID=A0A7J9AX49_9ROSI|nr:hypothetical protein [Gossypium laxum]